MSKETTIEKSINLEDWEIFKFGEICKFVRGPFGGSLKKSIFKESGFAVYEQKHAIYDRFDNVRYFVDEEKFNEMKRFELNTGDLIMSCSGTIGKIAIVPDNIQRGIINQALLILSPNKKVSDIYLKLWLQSENFQDSLKKYTKGAAIKNVASVKILKNIEIPLPPLPQQKQIVATLDKAFAAIATAKANAQQNLQNAKELFESYLQNVFSTKGDDWEEKTLGEVCNKIQDGAHHSPKILYPTREKGLFPYVTSKNVKNNYMDLSKLQFVDETFHQTIYPRCKPEMGDVLLTKDGAKTGNVTLNTLDEPFSLLSSVCLIKTNKNELRADFLKYYIQSPIGFKSITGKMTGAAIKRIILRAIKSATIPLPLVDEQKEIVKNIDSLLAETKKLEAMYTQKIADLEELKKSVLQKAFSGQLSEL